MNESDRNTSLMHQKQDRKRSSTKMMDISRNPCLPEQRMAYKCLSDNDYDRDECTKYFQNYKNCNDFWKIIVRKRRAEGTIPYLPPVDERPQIFKDNQNLFSWK